MSTPFDMFGVVAPAGSKVVAALIFPTGKVTAASTTITGGTVTGTTTIGTSSSVIYLGLSEVSATLFDGTGTIGGTALPDTTTEPYTAAARIVGAGTDMTSYSAIAAAYAAATASGDQAYLRDVPAWMQGGMLDTGAWTSAVVVEAGSGGGGPTVEEITTALMDLLAGIGAPVHVVRAYVNGDIEIRKGDTYGPTSGQRITIVKPAGAQWPTDLSTWALTFTANKKQNNHNEGDATLTVTCTHGTETGSAQSFHIDMALADTDLLAVGMYDYDVQASSGDLRNTLIAGAMRVLPEMTV